MAIKFGQILDYPHWLCGKTTEQAWRLQNAMAHLLTTASWGGGGGRMYSIGSKEDWVSYLVKFSVLALTCETLHGLGPAVSRE